jgi:hypothetical protein
MQNTEKNALKKPDDTQKPRIQPTGSKPSEEKQRGESYQLANLSLRTAKRLENCMDSLAKEETVESVKAICMCAGELNKIMKLNLEFYKEGM